MAVVRTGDKINPTLKKVVDGGPHNGEELDVNNQLCSISGLPVHRMANAEGNASYRDVDSADCIPEVQCLGYDVTFTVENESTQTATAEANPSGGVGPYTYAWSNSQTTKIATGLLKNTAYTVVVTDSVGCTETRSVTPNITVLTGLKLELMYFVNDTAETTDPYYPRLCFGSHTCNRARFEVFANGFSQGIANLNNLGGTSVADGTIDDQNHAPDYPNYSLSNISDRYWGKSFSGADAAAIANSEGKVVFTLNWTGIDPQGPHADTSWLRITREDNVVLLSTCISSFSSYQFDPYA